MTGKTVMHKGAPIALVTASLLGALTFWEGRKYEPYQDIVGVWTVCAGITGPDVKPGKKYSQADCDELEGREIERHGRGVLECVTVQLPQKRYEALALFAYNVGIRGACGSTAVRLINAGQPAAGCDALLMWSKAGGQFVRGLHRRRVFEREWCLA